jgi:hypothetical protein
VRTAILGVPLAVTLVLSLSACGDDGGADVASPTTEPTSTSSPTATSTPSPSTGPTTPAEPVATAARPVYWVMDAGPAGLRLYREFVARPETDAPARDALEVMFAGQPTDSDYGSLWPSGTAVLSLAREGDLATVDLPESVRDAGAGAEGEAASLQQLVHTVTAAEPEVTRVQLTFDGQVQDAMWGHVDVSKPLRRGPALEVLGPIWVLTPPDGGTLAVGDEFGGEATAFEATVSWEWERDGEVVAEGFSTASEGAPGRGSWSSTVEVPPGDYVLRAFESSAEDGSMLFADTKRVTVTR